MSQCFELRIVPGLSVTEVCSLERKTAPPIGGTADQFGFGFGMAKPVTGQVIQCAEQNSVPRKESPGQDEPPAL